MGGSPFKSFTGMRPKSPKYLSRKQGVFKLVLSQEYIIRCCTKASAHSKDNSVSLFLLFWAEVPKWLGWISYSAKGVAKGRKILHLMNFFIKIKREFCSRKPVKKTSKRWGGSKSKFSCSTSCANLLKIRKNFAHNCELLHKEILRVLKDIHMLLKAFDHEDT